MADLMEKSIVILGQATVMASYFRRIQVMAKFLRSDSRAEKLVRQNSELLAANDKELFGKKFYSYLHQKAKVTKTTTEIRRGLAPPPRKPQSGGRQPFRAALSSGRRT
jgi:hypothetical protein